MSPMHKLRITLIGSKSHDVVTDEKLYSVCKKKGKEKRKEEGSSFVEDGGERISM